VGALGEFDCVVVESLGGPGCDLAIRAWCDLCGNRWTVADPVDLDEWMAGHAHPQANLFEAP
jgi:hypothetical protein